MPLLLLKYLPHLLIVISAVSVVGVGVYKIHQNGRMAERVEWQERESARISIQSHLAAEAEKNNALERDSRYLNLMEVVNAQAKLNNDLQRDIDGVADKRLYINTKSCGNAGSPMLGAPQNTSEPGSGAGRAELSESDAENIRRDYADAQRVVNQYLLCRQALMGIADIE